MSSPTRPAPAAADPQLVVTQAAPPPRRSSRLVLGITLVVGLVAGLGIARLLVGTSPATTPSVQGLDLPGVAEGPPPPPPPSAVEGDRLGVQDATSPEAAVRGFLTAEALGDFAASYAFLGPDDLATYPTAAAWVAAHADLPPITGFTVEEATGSTVVTLTGLRSTLDPVLGLIPARSRDTWETVEVDERFRVDHGASATAALYPSDEQVSAAVARWAEARQECRTEFQADAALLGAPALAEQLCGASGAVVVDEAAALRDGAEGTVLLNAYGPDVYTWARVVDVLEPVALQAVTAPIADEWQVIAVLPAP